MRIRSFVVAALGVASCFGQSKPAVSAKTMGASIYGFVEAENGGFERGTPLGFPWVTLIRKRSDLSEKFVPFSAGVPARANGAFSFTGLAPGDYQICAQLGNSTMLNPCEWGGPAPVFRVEVEQIVVGAIVTMKPGVAVPIRIDDPQQNLAKHEGKTPGAHLMVGIADSYGMFHTATLKGKDESGSDHQIVIPANMPVKLVVRSNFFQIADSRGVAIAANAPGMPVTVVSGKTPAAIVVKVTGIKQ